MGVVLDEAALESIDSIVTAGPYLLWDQLMDADDQIVFVMGAVEDGHFTPGRHGTMDSPQEIVREFPAEGCLNGTTLQPCGFMEPRM